VEQGKKVLVLEARDRVGGHVYKKYLDDKTYLDLGAAASTNSISKHNC
jgi:phytoene dehydrogenase-like protein